MSLHASCVSLKNVPQRRRVGCDVLVVSFPLKSPEGTFVLRSPVLLLLPTLSCH